MSPKRLSPAFLLAATIDGRGQMNLDVPPSMRTPSEARLLVSLDGMGEPVERRVGIEAEARLPQEAAAWGPLDWRFFAECLASTFGRLTPERFRLTGSEGGRSFLRDAPEDQTGRERLLHTAFSLHLVAYEERLV